MIHSELVRHAGKINRKSNAAIYTFFKYEKRRNFTIELIPRQRMRTNGLIYEQLRTQTNFL